MQKQRRLQRKLGPQSDRVNKQRTQDKSTKKQSLLELQQNRFRA